MQINNMELFENSKGTANAENTNPNAPPEKPNEKEAIIIDEALKEKQKIVRGML